MRSALILCVALIFVAACEAGESPTAPAPEIAAVTTTADAAANPDGSCKVRRLRTTRTGNLRTTNCVFTGLGYPAYADVYRFRPDREFPDYDPAVQLSAFTFEVTSDFTGSVGLKEHSADDALADGTLYAGVRLRAVDPARFSIIGDQNRYQLFLLGGPAQTGAYEITTTETEAGAFTCGDITALVPPISFSSFLRKSTACDIDYGSRATDEHQWFVQVPIGGSYTVRVDGFTGRSEPELRAIGFGGTVIASDAERLEEGQTFREITVTVDPSVIDPTQRFVLVSVADRRRGDYTITVN